ncbi:ATP-binding cassette domain-containing protein [Halostella sp. JP-L12]|uniref:ATP-binding cassette domain-containing protein n=1 Tax=Halostella TaxID=1843185 RepID=UPI000EF84536|nr:MULTISPECIES: ATP-binding cassette domain-containing protein [Halostella]NHN49702.1 ATP-binding cassette domain-containing protein [Halostella sp. JP-L12]
MIDVECVTVSLGGTEVLTDVSASVDRGSFVGLVGPNGAGKTTLLRTISGAISPDSGRVLIDGEDVHRLSSKAASRRVAVVPQETHLAFSFDVETAVAMGRHPYRSRFGRATDADRAAVERAMERTGVGRFADRSVEAVSGGERQRVLLARALAQDTPVLLLDEPTASLDVNHQVETLELVSDLVADGKTAVAAIHDLNLAARYCDELVMLADGGVLAHGTPAEVLSEANLADAFDADAVVTRDGVTGSLSVTALADRPAEDATVHVVGGGETGARVLDALGAAGFERSAGPLAAGDAAAETARAQGVDLVTTAPFEAVDDDALAALENRVTAADATVLADPVLTPGNREILGTLADADPIVVVETRPFEERNRAGDDARDTYESIRRRAAVVPAEDVPAAVRELRTGVPAAASADDSQ